MAVLSGIRSPLLAKLVLTLLWRSLFIILSFLFVKSTLLWLTWLFVKLALLLGSCVFLLLLRAFKFFLLGLLGLLLLVLVMLLQPHVHSLQLLREPVASLLRILLLRNKLLPHELQIVFSILRILLLCDELLPR